MIEKKMKILFICTHNRCRSILSEAITNQLAKGRIVARSAGSQPAGVIHPLTITYLRENDFSVQGLKSQSWDEFSDFNPDLIVTVCDRAAREVCPVWFGDSTQIHWGLEDPSKLEGSEQETAIAFQTTINEIKSRIQALLALDVENIDTASLKHAMQTLGAV